MQTGGTRSIKKDRIVQAAGKLFARQGYHGTSTREIAHLADVSENTLFRHFEHKENIFWSALRSQATEIKLPNDLQEGLSQGDSPEMVLPKIFESLTETVNYRPELLRLIAVAFVELYPKAELFSREYLSPALSAICGYLEMNIKSGKIRVSDSRMLTAALVMTGLMHSGISSLIEGDKPDLNWQKADRACSGFWLDLLVPKMYLLAPPAGNTSREMSD
jgi:AcrR family transcriptional regulator